EGRPPAGKRPVPAEPRREQTELTPPIPLTPTTPDLVVEESGLGGFEPPPRHPWEEPAPGPAQEEVDLENTAPVDRAAREREPTPPRPETRVVHDPDRRFPASLEELRQLVSERLRQAYEAMQTERKTGRPLSEFDALLAELQTRDPELAARVEEYYAALENT